MNKIVYYYKNIEYDSYDDLKKAVTNVSWPEAILPDNMLRKLGITREVKVIEDTKPEVVINLDEYKVKKAKEIRNVSDVLIAKLSDNYSQGEIQTFEQQYKGATDIILNNDISTNEAQFIILLLTNRLFGAIPTSQQIYDFANLIISNYNKAKAATLLIVGTQQKLELAVRACTTKEQVDSITWPQEILSMI